MPSADDKESGSSCCCCCRRPKKSPAKELERLNGERLAAHDTPDTLNAPFGQDTSNFSAFQRDNLGPTEDVDAETPERCQERCSKCCKSFTTFLFSNIGLCSAVVAYSILGGFIFQTLEAPHEILKRHFVNQRRSEYAQRIWNLTQKYNVFFEANLTRDAETLLVEFQEELLEARKNGWDGQDGDVEQQWSYAGSLLYSVTVITTIGYGHIAPKTFYGRLVTIFYALVGIPLTLLCLANMGSFLGNCFRIVYKRTSQVCMWMCCPAENTSRRRKTSQARVKDSRQELDPLQFKTTSRQNSSNKLEVISGPSRSMSRCPSEINIVIEDYDQSKVKGKEKQEPIRVPIFVSLMIISMYIFGGALMFSMWEDWDYLEGSYFCFITLSTVGFGDYVPGSISKAGDSPNNNRLIICCVYLLFGLSIIAMCFNLMQEDVRAKFLWLAIQIGLVDEN